MRPLGACTDDASRQSSREAGGWRPAKQEPKRPARDVKTEDVREPHNGPGNRDLQDEAGRKDRNRRTEFVGPHGIFKSIRPA